jgi:pyrimidine operon attenuation protein/uracil phosphoribosyltransferase
MTPEDIDRALRRMAHEIVESNAEHSDLLILGIHTRGFPLATRLARHLESLTSHPVPHGSLDVSGHRDDGDHRTATHPVATVVPGDINDRAVVMVDDVLYTGRTVRAGLDCLSDLGRPSRVQLAVLVDRGHRELPIRADFVGKNLPTSPTERVAVKLNEVDDDEGVWIEPTAVANEEGRL